jgi:hypothetical protein
MALFAALLLALETLGPALTALTVFSAAKLAATATRKAQYDDEDTPSWTAIGIDAALILIPVGLGKAASVVRGAAGSERGLAAFWQARTMKLAGGEARRLLAFAAEEEPAVTSTLREVASAGGGRLVGLENAVKTEASLTRKIGDQAIELLDDASPGEAVSRIGSEVKDALRYTVEADPARYVSTYEHTVEALKSEGFTQLASKNTWARPGSPGAGPYRGINESWLTPARQVFELQFHTPESFAMKTLIHPLYEEVRAVGVSMDRVIELTRQMVEMSDTIPVPPGAVPGGL